MCNLNVQKNVVEVITSNGKVTVDRKLYEQKLRTLIDCNTVEEVLELSDNSKNYLEEIYKVPILQTMIATA